MIANYAKGDMYIPDDEPRRYDINMTVYCRSLGLDINLKSESSLIAVAVAVRAAT